MVPPEHELSIDQDLMALHQLVETASGGQDFYNRLNGVVIGPFGGVTLWRSDDGSAVTARGIEAPDGIAEPDASPITATVHLTPVGGLRMVLLGEAPQQWPAPDHVRFALVRSVATYALAEFANGEDEGSS